MGQSVSNGTIESAYRAVFKAANLDAEPYNHQSEFAQVILDEKNAILQAGTGSGKTEAALIPCLLSGKRIFLIYPSKALLQDQRDRVANICEAVLPQRAVKILVDTGEEADLTGYSADVVLTSLDKLVYRFFGYGRKRWSFIYPYRLGFGSAESDRQSVLIFDEAHVYEEIIFSHFWFLVEKLTYERRIQTLILSATFPEDLKRVLEDPERKFFPRPKNEGAFFSVVNDEVQRTGTTIFRGECTTEEALFKGLDLYKQGKKVVIVYPNIRKDDGLASAWKKVVAEANPGDIAHLNDEKVTGGILTYHGQQWPAYRCKVLSRILELDKDRPYLVLTTGAMEVGVDISADILFSGPRTVAGFVQQVGRCARRNGKTGDVYLIKPSSNDADVVEDQELENVATQIRQILSKDQKITPERKAELNRLNMPPDPQKIKNRLEYLHDQSLYRYIYDFIPENAELWRHGVIVTRSWEPTIPVALWVENDGKSVIGGIAARDFWNGKPLKDVLEIPVSWASEIAPMCVWTFSIHEEENNREVRKALGGQENLTFEEVLSRLGYSLKSAGDVRRLPLILVLPSSLVQKVFDDMNLGLAGLEVALNLKYKPPKPAKNPYHSGLVRYEVEFAKKKPDTKLMLWWDEPAKEVEA